MNDAPRSSCKLFHSDALSGHMRNAASDMPSDHSRRNSCGQSDQFMGAESPGAGEVVAERETTARVYLLGRATLPVATAVAVVLRAFVAADITVTVAAPLITCPCTFDTRTLNRAPLSPSAADARV